uniref:Uncharacterized protein n=1 Tax=Arundo donax TaxID=35708 RepID=A0A0A9FJ62_ARUDO
MNDEPESYTISSSMKMPIKPCSSIVRSEHELLQDACTHENDINSGRPCLDCLSHHPALSEPCECPRCTLICAKASRANIQGVSFSSISTNK